jgi:phage tail-like protein
MTRNDPLRDFRFRLEIDQVIQGHFSEVTIDTTTDSIDHRQGTDAIRVRKLPGLTKYSNISLKWGVTDSAELYEWHKAVLAAGATDNRKTVRIVVLDEAGADKASFLVSEAWPTKYDPSDLHAKGKEVFIELLELANEGIKRSG